MTVENAAAVARQFLDLLSAADFGNWSKLLATDVSMVFPFAPNGVPSRIDGRENCETATRQVLGTFATMEMYDIVFQEGKDPEFVVATARSRATTRAGKSYANEYVFMFRVRNGLVYSYREYFNPLPILAAFGPASSHA